MQSSSQIITTIKPTANFLQSRCHSCFPTNSMKTLKEFCCAGTTKEIYFLYFGRKTAKCFGCIVSECRCWLQTLILRDWWLCTVISVMFEVVEYTLEHQLPNFSECWWDHVSISTLCSLPNCALLPLQLVLFIHSHMFTG